MQQPLISVIVPCYNIENLLSKTVDSILAQTYSNLEVILVNDGSRDETGAVIEKFAERDPRVHAIHQENGGVTRARLRGVSEARGQWIGFVDGDDYVEPDMYELLIKNALAYDADISHCGYQMVFPNRVDLYHGTEELRQQNHMQGLQDLLTGTLVEPGLVNKLYKSSLLQKLMEDDCLDQSIKINEDVLMNFYLFSYAKKSVFHDICKYHYVVRAGSAANAKINEHQLYDPLKVTRIMLEETKQIPELQRILTERLLHQQISMATMETKEAPELLQPAKRQARRELRQRLGKTLSGSCGIKLKLMALWTAIWPGSYGFVHRVYAHAKGLDHIYDLD